MNTRKLTLAALLTAATFSPLSHADAGFGAGLTYVFGEGFAVGLKVFSDDQEDKAVAAIGIDYMLTSGAWRPNAGVGYLGDNIYGDFSAGYNYQTGAWNFGLGGGATDTEDDSATAGGAGGGHGAFF